MKAINDYFLQLLETKNLKQKLTTNTCILCIILWQQCYIFNLPKTKHSNIPNKKK